MSLCHVDYAKIRVYVEYVLQNEASAFLYAHCTREHLTENKTHRSSSKTDIFVYTVTCLTHYYQGSQICCSRLGLCRLASSYK